MEEEKYIELFPGHWLNNASIIGFMISLEVVEKRKSKDYLNDDGRFIFSRDEFELLDIENRYFSENKISSIIGKAPIYRNYLQPSEKAQYSQYVKALKFLQNTGINDVFGESYNLPMHVVEQLRTDGLEKFMDRIIDFNMIFHADIAPSLGMFPNAYWNTKQSNKISHLFSFLIIHQHLSFTSLNGLTKIFINAPSFKLMYELNKLINKSFEWSRDNNNKSLLAMTVIEYCAKTNAMLGLWSGMNIEIVAITKKIKDNGQFEDIIEYYNLPSNVIQIISNKKISTLLSDIGEFKILNLVLDEKYKELVEMAYRILKISMKDDYNKGDQKYINDYLFLSRNKYNKTAQRLVANKILKLYALIDERIKTN